MPHRRPSTLSADTGPTCSAAELRGADASRGALRLGEIDDPPDFGVEVGFVVSEDGVVVAAGLARTRCAS